MQPVNYWVQHLALQPHPEGGYFRELYRATEEVDGAALPPRFGGPRSFATSIVYLLQVGQRSVFHRIKSDETWHFYAGGPLELFQLDEHKPEQVLKIVLGPELHSGQHLQWTVPAGVWFGSRPLSTEPDGYALLGCTVSPGFDFADFDIAEPTKLDRLFPAHAKLVAELT